MIRKMVTLDLSPRDEMAGDRPTVAPGYSTYPLRGSQTGSADEFFRKL